MTTAIITGLTTGLTTAEKSRRIRILLDAAGVFDEQLATALGTTPEMARDIVEGKQSAGLTQLVTLMELCGDENWFRYIVQSQPLPEEIEQMAAISIGG